MPIHDQGYRRYEGTRSELGRRWAVIVRAGVWTMFTKKAFIGLLLLSYLPFVIRAVQIYITTSVPQAASLLPINAKTFRDFLSQQEVFVFFITVYVGAGLIANDRRANALQIYLSKPLTRVEYIFGKLSVLMTFLLLVTALPGIMLLVLQVAFTGDTTFFRENIHLVPAIAVFSFVQTTTSAATMLALSSLSKSSRYVGVLYTAVIFLTQAIYGVLRAVTGSTSVAWVSFSANLSQVSAAVFRVPPDYDTPWPISLGVLVAIIALSGVVLEKRVRGVEIVT